MISDWVPFRSGVAVTLGRVRSPSTRAGGRAFRCRAAAAAPLLRSVACARQKERPRLPSGVSRSTGPDEGRSTRKPPRARSLLRHCLRSPAALAARVCVQCVPSLISGRTLSGTVIFVAKPRARLRGRRRAAPIGAGGDDSVPLFLTRALFTCHESEPPSESVLTAVNLARDLHAQSVGVRVLARALGSGERGMKADCASDTCLTQGRRCRSS